MKKKKCSMLLTEIKYTWFLNLFYINSSSVVPCPFNLMIKVSRAENTPTNLLLGTFIDFSKVHSHTNRKESLRLRGC